MRYRIRIALLIIFVLSSLTVAVAQSSSAVNDLRSQLSDVQAKDTEQRNRLKQLDEDLRPESIERFFALNGSTHPEVLREQRRGQLEGQKANVQAQLDQLASSRARLESAIAVAEAAAYRQSALSSTLNSTPEPASVSSPTVKPKQTGRRHKRRRARRRG